MLTENQQNVFDVFMNIIELKAYYFLSSEDRAIGKTHTLNELAFTLQALGYKVYVLTPYGNCEYYAEKYISTSVNDFRDVARDKLVIIVDESRYFMMDELTDYCIENKIPIIGYVNFGLPKMVNDFDFKQEYECIWNVELIKEL